MRKREHASQKRKPKHARLQSVESKTELNRIYGGSLLNEQKLTGEDRREKCATRENARGNFPSARETRMNERTFAAAHRLRRRFR